MKAKPSPDKRPFAAFDIDGTVIRWQLYHAIANHLIKRGKMPPESVDKIHASRMRWKERRHGESFRHYEDALIEAYYASIVRVEPEAYNQAIDAVFNEYKDQVYTYSRDLINRLKQAGYLLFAISGSQQEIIERLAAYYGFDAAIGTLYERRSDGYFTGRSIRASDDKGQALKDLLASFDATWADSWAVGDSESDIRMLELVENPVAFNSNSGLLQAAKSRGWPIVVERKNVIYELNSQNGTYVLA